MSHVKRARESNDPAVLARLARDSKNQQVRRALAGNPSAPWEILRDLLVTHPREVLDNPSFPLLLLSDPGLLQRLPVGALRGLASARLQLGRILGWSETPPFTELQLTLLCVVHVRGRFPFTDRYKPALADLRRILVERQLLSDEIELYLVHDPSDDVRRALAASSKATQVIESLLDVENNHPGLATNLHLPTCYQWALASIGSPSIRLRLARNPSVSATTLEKLADDPEPSVRCAVALAAGTPVALWERLHWDPSHEVQAAARRAKRPEAQRDAR